MNYNGCLEDGEWHRSFVTWRINPNATDEEIAIDKHVVLRIFKGWKVEVCGVKFERGEKATDWSPMPEETDNELINIGSRNYILNSNFYSTDNISSTYGTYNGWGINSNDTSIEEDTSIMHNNNRYLHRYRINQSQTSWTELQYWINNINNINDFKGRELILSFFVYVPDVNWLNDNNNDITMAIRYRKNEIETTSEFVFPNIKNEFKKAVNNWYRIVESFTFPSNLDDIDRFFIMLTHSKNFNYYLSEFKLEIGNKPTDWTPAPEDIENHIENVQTTLSGDLSDINDKLDKSVKTLQGNIDDKISMAELKEALQTFKDNYKLAEIDPDKINGVITALASGNSEGKYSILQQNGDGYTFGMGDVIKALQENAKDLDDLKNYNLEDLENELKDLSKSRTYIRFTETVENGETKSTIILGTKDSPFQVRITNTSIDFLENTGRTQEKFEMLRIKPKDWDTNYQNYYILSNDEYIHISGQTAPTWEVNTYYELINEPIYNRLAYANNNTFFNEKTVVKEEIQIVKEDNQGNVKRIYLENKS